MMERVKAVRLALGDTGIVQVGVTGQSELKLYSPGLWQGPH
jgi:hypothetical protein